jgi:asparagine synthase (glutamine-hydrolysing)
MCGILGWVGAVAVNEESRVQVGAALATLRHRGPNGTQTEAGTNWILGHTRLKILDLTERAAQPMQDSEGRWLVFNGEIYNFREIRRELETKGRRFHSTGDTEVLLQALAHWGLDALTKLHGMFAFGWLDPERRELVLARDRFGVKPLVWETAGNGVRFASDLRALDAMAAANRDVDIESARAYMMLGYVPAPRTIWKGPRKVMPGTYVRVRWSDNLPPDLAEQKYWSLKEVPPAGTQNGSTTDAQFREKLRAAVQSRLISDVPVGLLLSGGIDSSSVAAACAELPIAEANVPAYTMGFATAGSDERLFARSVAEILGIRHEDFVAEESDIASLFEHAWSAFDEPFADSSALPMLILCREIAKRVTVAIGGDGGDEVWCGYPWHRALYRAERLSWLPSAARRAVGRLAMTGGSKLRYRGMVLAASDRIDTWAVLKTGLTRNTARFLPVDAEPIPTRSYFEDAAKNVEHVADPLDWAGRMDLMTYLPDDLMVKADRASMDVGLELREPLLDYNLVEWGLTLPTHQRFDCRLRLGKRPARRYLASRLPPRILSRKKQGFTPPLQEWLKGALREHRSLALAQLHDGNLYPLVLPKNCQTWDDCSKILADTHSQFLWRIICFSGWLASRRRLRSASAGSTSVRRDM